MAPKPTRIGSEADAAAPLAREINGAHNPAPNKAVSFSPILFHYPY